MRQFAEKYAECIFETAVSQIPWAIHVIMDFPIGGVL
jgi:hypothetical protein